MLLRLAFQHGACRRRVCTVAAASCACDDSTLPGRVAETVCESCRRAVDQGSAKSPSGPVRANQRAPSLRHERRVSAGEASVEGHDLRSRLGRDAPRSQDGFVATTRGWQLLFHRSAGGMMRRSEQMPDPASGRGRTHERRSGAAPSDRTRQHSRRAIALLCASAAALAQTWPGAAREATATAESVLTLRTAGDHNALWLLPPAGAPTGPGDSLGCVYVADVAGGSLERTSFDLISRASAAWVMDVAWSEGTKLVVDALDSSSNMGDSTELHVLVLDAADLSKLTDLGEGHLSVWVR